MPDVANKSDTLRANKDPPLLRAMVSANKNNGALIMRPTGTKICSGRLLRSLSSTNLSCYSSTSALRRRATLLREPIPGPVAGFICSRTRRRRYRDPRRGREKRDDWKVAGKANRYQLAVGGKGDEGKHFLELVGSQPGLTMLNAVGDYHAAFSDNQPLKIHIYSEGKPGSCW